MQALIDIVLELLLVGLLLVQFLAKVLDLVGKTLLSHSEIINNQCQVQVHSIEVLQLLTHLVCLLIQGLNLELSWTDISLQLLDLIIEHKLELLQLLGLLLEIDDTLVLVFDGLVSLLQLVLLTLDLLLQLTDDLQQLG
jgi:hypothetical protein